MITENKRAIPKARKIIGSAVVLDGPLNIRKKPNTDAEIVGQTQKGQRFNVTEGSTTDFTAIIYKDEVRYAMTKYLDVTTNS